MGSSQFRHCFDQLKTRPLAADFEKGANSSVVAQPEMSFRAYGPRNPMKIAQSKIRAARSSEVEFSLDEVEAVEMSDPERA